ncbi:tRNA pseudouridine(55) synthase TruB [Candidatus Tisiphia endosymbiont of Sialis lutaria]|uniref:tRNA pseudouridine(55) synthase TruB n=1 Tax=Candidatus Tisiphia endosymbiont of Sialis lutaria TaxID=2029164 RepID=UPI00312C9DD7
MFHHNNYWLNIYKPKGISSAKLVSIVKKNLLGVKVGHCGTLDVEAEGVLPLAIGEATKLVRILVDAKKTYIFTVQFGKQTDTADASGKVIGVTDHIPNETDCHNICKKFIATIKQRPPAFSAIKVNGVRSYKLARENLAVELTPRNIQIYNLECLNFDHQNNQATYRVECSKGTYVRTLAEDIALSLQSLAFVLELQRTKVGIFTACNAIKLTELDEQNQGIKEFLEKRSIKIEAVLDDILVLDATTDQAKKIIYGQKCYFDCLEKIRPLRKPAYAQGFAGDTERKTVAYIDVCEDLSTGSTPKLPAEVEFPKRSIELVWIRYQDSLLAIGSLSENCFNSLRVFNL